MPLTGLSTRRQWLRGAASASTPVLLRARPSNPNVLWIMTDEHRPDSIRAYGSPWAYSPNLDRLAENGVLFESAYTPSPVCVPARCCLLTGDYGSTTGVLQNQAKLRANARLLTWEFERAGYGTASFGKKHYFLPAPHQAFQMEGGSALDKVVDAEAYGSEYDGRQFDAVQYPDAPTEHVRRRWILAGKFPAPIAETAEAHNVDLAIRWLDRREAEKPFLLRLSLNAPHTPVVAPEQFLRRIDPKRIDLPMPADADLASAPERTRVLLRDFEGSQRLTPAELQQARHYYYARVAFADFEIGRLLDWMRARGLLDNTIVAMTADHGADLGDHGLLQKLSFYEQVVTVPYLFSWPGVAPKGTRLRTPVNTISLLPTLLRLSGLPVPHVEAADVSRPISRGEEPPAGPVFSEVEFGYMKYRDNDRQVMVRDGNLKLSLFLKRGDPRAFAAAPDGELYDLARDPLERKNLFGNASYQDAAARLQSRIVEWDRARGASETGS